MSIFGKKHTKKEAATVPEACGKETQRAHSQEMIGIDYWPDDKLIPGDYADWLGFCLYDHIFPVAHGLNIGDIMMVRYDLAKFRGKRIGQAYMIPVCPEVFFLEKFARGHSYIVRDRKGNAIGLVFNGFAIGKGTLMKREEYNLFPTAGIAKSMDEELDDAERLFGEKDRIKIWKSDNTCFLSIGDMK